ncbi:MAG TPA: hypothetical protein VH575_12465 [Gemmataceae bacterium]|jgi:hypothetical protein
MRTTLDVIDFGTGEYLTTQDPFLIRTLEQGFTAQLTIARALQGVGATVHPPAATRRPSRGKHIDAEMLRTIRDRPEAAYWTARQWAEHLGCGKSTVGETNTWRTHCRLARERERLARGQRLRRSRTA